MVGFGVQTIYFWQDMAASHHLGEREGWIYWHSNIFSIKASSEHSVFSKSTSILFTLSLLYIFFCSSSLILGWGWWGPILRMTMILSAVYKFLVILGHIIDNKIQEFNIAKQTIIQAYRNTILKVREHYTPPLSPPLQTVSLKPITHAQISITGNIQTHNNVWKQHRKWTDTI